MMGLRANQHYTFNGQSNTIKFWNGSEVILLDLFAYPSDPNFDDLGSLEITDWFIDEVSQITKKAVDIVRSRVRFKLREYNLSPKGLMTCNPSKGWLYNEFYAPFKADNLPVHYRFIPSRVTDNIHLPATYAETLARLPEIDRKRLLEGDWDYDESIDYLFHTDDLQRCFRDETFNGNIYITADIARLGKDRTVIAVWRGLQLIELHELRKQKVTEVAAYIQQLISKTKAMLKHVVVDEDGVGGGCCDILRCRGFMNGSRAVHSDKYMNLKTECYFKLAELIEKNEILFPTSHRDIIIKELDMIRRKHPDKDGKLAVSSKDEIKKIHGVSPDYADAIMMRMYDILIPNYGKYSYVTT